MNRHGHEWPDPEFLDDEEGGSPPRQRHGWFTIVTGHPRSIVAGGLAVLVLGAGVTGAIVCHHDASDTRSACAAAVSASQQAAAGAKTASIAAAQELAADSDGAIVKALPGASAFSAMPAHSGTRSGAQLIAAVTAAQGTLDAHPQVTDLGCTTRYEAASLADGASSLELDTKSLNDSLTALTSGVAEFKASETTRLAAAAKAADDARAAAKKAAEEAAAQAAAAAASASAEQEAAGSAASSQTSGSNSDVTGTSSGGSEGVSNGEGGTGADGTDGDGGTSSGAGTTTGGAGGTGAQSGTDTGSAAIVPAAVSSVPAGGDASGSATTAGTGG